MDHMKTMGITTNGIIHDVNICSEKLVTMRSDDFPCVRVNVCMHMPLYAVPCPSHVVACCRAHHMLTSMGWDGGEGEYSLQSRHLVINDVHHSTPKHKAREDGEESSDAYRRTYHITTSNLTP